MSINLRVLIAGILLLSLQGTARAQMRVWADRVGNQYTAEFSKEAFGSIFLRDVSGTLFSIKLDDLSASDTKFIRTMAAPSIRVNVSSKIKALPTSSYAEDLEQVWLASETIQIEKISQARFDGKLSGEVYQVGKDILTGRYLMLLTQEFYPVFTAENHERYKLTVSTKVRHWEEYNMIQNRGYDYAGYLVVISGPRGERLATKSSLPRFSNDALEALRGFPYFTFFNGDGQKVSVPRPEYSEDRRISDND